MTTIDEVQEQDRTRDKVKAAHVYTETWCKHGEVGYVELTGGARVRYLRVGNGPPLVLIRCAHNSTTSSS